MIVVSTHPITADVAAAGPVPIGRPLAGKRLHVLDERLRPVADGQTGELYASGEGLAHGYLRRPGFTAERFVACPSGPPGERMYRTGDVVRWHADAPAEFAGRLDERVKIRGFRVELKEVETALARHLAVARVAVVAVKDHQGEKQLVAYAVPHAGQSLEPIEATLRAYASATMPQFMVPSAFVAMRMFPLTHNGKLDHSALPAPGPAATAVVSREPRDHVPDGYEPPRTELERRLAGIWADVLGVERVGLHDNFFSLGGNSLRAVRIAARIVTAEDLPARADQIFIAPTVADLADPLAREEPQDLPRIPRTSRVARRRAGVSRPWTSASCSSGPTVTRPVTRTCWPSPGPPTNSASPPFGHRSGISRSSGRYSPAPRCLAPRSPSPPSGSACGPEVSCCRCTIRSASPRTGP